MIVFDVEANGLLDKATKIHCLSYTDDGKDINGYYLQTDNYTLYYNRDEQFLKMEAIRKVAHNIA